MPPINRLSTRVGLYNTNIDRTPGLKGLVKAIEDSEGNISFVTTFDGMSHTSLSDATARVSSLGINEFRRFVSTPRGTEPTARGLRHIEEEARLIDETLSRNSTRGVLKELGLEHLMGQNVTVDYLKFNYGGKAQDFTQLLETDFAKKAGLLNITDEGVTILNYRTASGLLSGRQQKQLQYALGVGKIREDFAMDLLKSGDYSKLAKLPKRMQGMLASRDVSISDEIIQSMGVEGKIFRYDDVGTFLMGLTDPESISDAHRFLMLQGSGVDKKTLKKLTRSTMTGSDRQQMQNILAKKIDELTGGSMQAGEIGRLRTDIQRMGYGSDFKNYIKGLTELSSDSPDRQYGLMVKSLMGGIEKMRDGQFIGNVNLFKEIEQKLIEQKSAFISSLGPSKTIEEIEQIKQMDSEIEKVRLMIERAGKESTIARLHFGGGQAKGEMLLLDFADMPDALKDSYFILTDSAMKGEIGAENIKSMLFNVAQKHKDVIYTDPLMTLYDPEYMGDPEFLNSLKTNAEMKVTQMKEFAKTGVTPDEVLKGIQGEISRTPAVPVAEMTPGARAMYYRARQEAQTIQDLLQSGIDPRKIPQLVRRVNDYYATQAFRLKGDRVDLAMPDTTRLATRTYESSMDVGRGAQVYQKTFVKFDDEAAKIVGRDIEELNFVQFRIRGNQMLMSGANAHLYHHSLGTFDLDDKGMPMMRTFTDANGNDRMAFMTYRAPTGLQEKIYMQADMADKETLKQFLESPADNYKSLINDADAMSILNSEEQKTLGIIQNLMSGKKGSPKFKSSQEVESLLLKLRKNFGSKHGFTDTLSLAQKDLVDMAVTRSASPLGIDRLIRNADGTYQRYQDFLVKAGIDPDTMPQYSKGNFYRVLAKGGDMELDKQFVSTFSSMQGQKFKNRKEIENFINSLSETSDQGKAARINLRAAQQELAESLQRRALPSVENTLGLYINRQASAASMTNQIDDILSTFKGQTIDVNGTAMDISDYYRRNFSIGLIPPSEAVDVSKQMIGEMIAKEQFEAARILHSEGRLSEKVLVEHMQDLARRLGVGGQINLATAGEHAVEQTGRGVGFLRAMQIAAGVSEEELIGFDPALLDYGPYSRIKGQDMESIRQSMLSEVRNVLDQTTEETAKGRLQIFIDELSKGKAEEALAKVTLKQGTQAYEKYAKTAMLRDIATNVRDTIEGEASSMMKQARLGTDILEATATSKYVDPIDQILESQRQSFERLTELSKAGADDMLYAAQQMKDEASIINTRLYEGMSAIAERESGTNALDLMDTMEARIRMKFGRRATSVLDAGVGIGEEDAMMSLRRDALSRRLHSSVKSSANLDLLDQMDQLAQQELGVGSYTQITKQQAKDLIEYSKNRAGFAGRTGVGTTVSQDLIDYATMIDQGEYAPGGTQAAREAFAYVQAEEKLADINSRHGATAAASALLDGSNISDEARTLTNAIDSADQSNNIFRGTYTRIKDAMKSEAVRDAFKDPIIRRSAYAAIGLAAFGFIYSARKDRTQDEMSGPPLLPGGSAYESDFPQNVPSISDLKFLNPTTLGMQYKINIMGSQADLEKMQTLAAGVADGPINSTMYDSLPRLGRDPYSSVASRF